MLQLFNYAIERFQLAWSIIFENYFTRDSYVILTMTYLKEDDCHGIEISQRSFPDIKPFGIRWQNPVFVRDDSIDVTDIRQPGKEKKTDPVKERMLAALHASNFEGGLGFAEFLRAIQIRGPSNQPTPSKTTFNRKIKDLTAQKLIEKS